jgi:hypothetical protein
MCGDSPCLSGPLHEAVEQARIDLGMRHRLAWPAVAVVSGVAGLRRGDSYDGLPEDGVRGGFASEKVGHPAS